MHEQVHIEQCVTCHDDVFAACLDTITTLQQLGLGVTEDEEEKKPQVKVFTKEDFSVVNRFDSEFSEFYQSSER